MVKRQVQVPLQYTSLTASLHLPANARGLIIFADASGNSRMSMRNNYMAGCLNQNAIGTLLADMLTPIENEVYANRFNITLLCSRLIKITQWALAQSSLQGLPLGYLGSNTGAAAALQAAPAMGNTIKAIVSRGGRGDLAKGLCRVQAPTMLLAGSLDTRVLELNKQVYSVLRCEKLLDIVTGASHLFEEPGKLQQVALTAGEWFERYVCTGNKNPLNN